MTIRQISEYENKYSRLNAAKAISDEDTVQRLKQEVEDAWNYLLLIDPMKKENAYSLIEFFLNKIQEDPKEELTNEQCKWKVLALARSLAENPVNISHSSIRRV